MISTSTQQTEKIILVYLFPCLVLKKVMLSDLQSHVWLRITKAQDKYLGAVYLSCSKQVNSTVINILRQNRYYYKKLTNYLSLIESFISYR